MVQVRLAYLLRQRGESITVCRKTRALRHQVFLRLLKGSMASITFRTLKAICTGLECTPDDLLVDMPEKKKWLTR